MVSGAVATRKASDIRGGISVLMDGAGALAALAPIINVKVKDIVHSPNTKVEVDGAEKVVFRPGGGGHTMVVSEAGLTSMAKAAGFPAGMAEKLTPKTFGNVATELLARVEEYAILVKDDQATAFVKKGTYRNLNAERVLETVQRAVPDFEGFSRVLINPDFSTSTELVTAHQSEVSKGDMVKAGALVTFSPIGTVLPGVQSYVNRLVCLNGATSNDVMRNFNFKGEGDSIWQWFRKAVKDAIESLDPIVARWRVMTAEVIAPEDRALILAAIIKDAKLPIEAASAMEQRALEAPPQNSYDMLNLLTWTTSHAMSEPVAIGRARRVVTEFQAASTHQRYCPTCRRQR